MTHAVAALLAPFALFAALPAAAQDVDAPRPNIVLVFIDDMGWADFSCFGNRDASTPHIDRMAAEGLRFGQFYVNAPICSPSRIAISTGQYPQRFRITSFLAHRANNRTRGMAQWLDPAAPMLARSLQATGYATGHFGKWHMGGQRDVDDAPPITDYGFDRSLTNFEGMGPKLLPMTARPGQEQPGRIWQDAERLGGPVTWQQRSTITGGFVDAAVRFIDRAAAARQPFYVNVWPDDVHGPFYPPVERWSEDRRERYLAVLEETDRQLAPLFARIRDDDALRDNTLVLICSDNGHEPGAGRSGVLRGCKTNLYEGGVRSPLIAWGPGLVATDATGTRNDTSVFAAFDLVPSLLALTATASATTFDGENVLDVLLGRSDASRTSPLFFSRPPDRKSHFGWQDLPDLAVRDGRWKLLCDFDGGRPQLYDVVADPGESNDVAAQNPDATRELIARVTAWYRSMGLDDGTHLVLDARLIERTDGVRLTVGTVTKHAANPLFGEELPWEARFDNLYANVLFDSAEQIYKCWYSPFVIDADEPELGRIPGTYMQALRATERPRTMGVCYATSLDGIRWTKPRMAVRARDDEQKTNLVDVGPHGAGIFRDAREPDPLRRYKRIAKEGGGGVAVAFSPDGLRWSRPVPCGTVGAQADTHNNALWVAERNRYVGFTRLWGGEPRQRIVGRTESPDFTSWTAAVPVLSGDGDRQTYAMPVFRYRGVYLGLVVVFVPRTDRAHTELAWSPDTVVWHRIDAGTPLIPTSPQPGAYDWGCVYAAAAPIVHDDEIRLYYGASDGPHTDWRRGALALATLRPDGFAGYEPLRADATGTVVTKPVHCASGAIHVTADAALGGSIRVHVVRKDGEPIASSEPITGNVTDHRVTFANGYRPPNRPVRLRFDLRAATLYAFR